MAACSAFSGISPSGSAQLLEGVLRKEWGLDGFVVSDCDAIGVMNWQHRTVNSLEEAVALGISSGCDLEHGGTYRENLVAAVQRGLVSEYAIDRALTRVLTMHFKLEEFDPIELVPYNHYDKELLAGEQFRRSTYETVVKSVILLKNEDNLLPIDKKDVRSIAIVGPFADNNCLGGYSGKPVHNISLLQGVKKMVGEEVEISCIEGTSVVSPVDSSYLLASDGVNNGLTADYIDGHDLNSPFLFSRIDKTVGFDWRDGTPDQRLTRNDFSVRWSEYLKAPVDGKHTIGAYANGGVCVQLDGSLVLDEWNTHGLQYYSVEVLLENGKKIPIKMEYINRIGAATCILVSDFGNIDQIDKMKKIVSRADLILVTLGSDRKLARENRDLPSIYLSMT